MSLHDDAVATLADWEAPTPAQESLRRRFRAHLEAHPDGLDRGCRPDHVTASTVVLDTAGRRVLLTLHAKAGRWFQFGGHCELVDATLAGAALREGTEESGIDGLLIDPVPVHLDEHTVTFCRIPGLASGAESQPGPAHHLDVRFLAVAPASAGRAVVSEESLDVRWFDVEDLPEPDLVDVVRAARARLSSWPPTPAAARAARC